MLYLGIETSSSIASAALCDENGIIAETILSTQLTHSQVILPMVKKLLSDAGKELSEVDCIAVANGPGSYTGLRIGIAAVKGMCMPLGCKCCGVSSLEELAYNVSAADAVVLSVMKARKGVVYAGAYKVKHGEVSCIRGDRVCPADELISFAQSVEGDILLVGDCCDELKQTLFSDMDNVITAPPKDRLHKASSVCFAAMNKEKCTAKQLQAVYLQETKAEKDKAHSDIKQ